MGILGIMLLVLSLLVPAALAVYAEGSQPSSDVQPQIVGPENNAAEMASDTVQAADGTGDNVLAPGDDPDTVYAPGEETSDGQPLLISAPDDDLTADPIYATAPVTSGLYEATPWFQIPSWVTATLPRAYENINIGQIVGQITMPAMPGYAYRVDAGSLKTNMPAINAPRIM